VSGGQAGAVNGQLGIMCGGEQADFDKAKPVMDSYAKMAALIGGPGSGQLTKMVNQICIVGIAEAWPKGLPSPSGTSSTSEKVISVSRKARRSPGRWRIAGSRWTS